MTTTTKLPTSRSRFEVLISTDPTDFGYGSSATPSDEALFARIGADFRGTVEQSGRYLSEQCQSLGGTYHRVVVREVATGKFWTRREFFYLVNDFAACRNARKYK
jgi:hypothetical protein